MMKIQETRSQAHSSAEEERGVTRRKQKAEKTHNAEQTAKKSKSENENESENGHEQRSVADVAVEFENFCKATREHLSIKQMREILEANGQDPSGADDAVVPQCQDLLFLGPLEKCPICGGELEYTGSSYTCTGFYSEWSSCLYNSRDPPRGDQQVILPDSVRDSPVSDLIRGHHDPSKRPQRVLLPLKKPFTGMTISLSGRLSRTHHYWKIEIEKNGGKVANSVIGVTCLVVSPAERERGGSSKLAEAMERGVPVVKEAWLFDSIEKQEAQDLEAYDLVGDLLVESSGIPLDKQDPSEEALQTISAELKIYGKRAVHKDTMLQDRGAKIFEKDGIVYNCASCICDQRRRMNNYCIMQLITVPDSALHLYCKKGRIGEEARVEERLEEWDNVDNAITEFARLFEELTGNEFEPWEREKKFHKLHLKFCPLDMGDGVDARHGGLGLRQLGIAVTHCKFQPMVANLLKILCSQEIYKYAMMEIGLDFPELPMGMLSDFQLKRCEEVIQEFIEKIKSSKEIGEKVEAAWADFSQRWFNLMPSTRPLILRDYFELAEHAAATLETVRDITVASHLIGDMTGSTLDDPLFSFSEKLGCLIAPLEKDTDVYEMILNYLEKTYEPVKVGDIDYGASVENIFVVDSSASTYDEVKNLSNKTLLWCGTRSSNLARHLRTGFLPAICSLPVPGYMFGKAIVCSDAAAEAARYGFTAVDRPEGFLVLAVVALGDHATEFVDPPEDTKSLEEKKISVKGLGRKEPDASEHIVWKDDIKVPCGTLVTSKHEQSQLEYNQYAVYDPKQASIRFLVAVKYEEKGGVMDTAE